MNNQDEDIGFLYAVLVPNIITRTVRVTLDSTNHPVTYKRDDFIALILKFKFFSIKPAILSILMKTQSVLWDVKKGTLTYLTVNSTPTSILQELVQTKIDSENYHDEMEIAEKYSRSQIDISNPDNPIFSLF